MINTLDIERFKSIRKLQIDCRRINLFIGEPNVGKSNILEALGLLSWCSGMNQPLNGFVRLKAPGEMFYDNLSVDAPLRVEVQGEVNIAVEVSFEADRFKVTTGGGTNSIALLDHNCRVRSPSPVKELSAIRFYRYRDIEKFDSPQPGSLLPPDGSNLFSCVFSSKDLRERVSELFSPYGLSLVMKPQDRSFEVQKNSDGVVTAFRYATTSDTLLRVIFFAAAMDSNKAATLVFEEPEAHAFPYFTKQMGEEIALGNDNQYFIATHNPYLLSAIVEKARKEDVNVFVTYFRDYETRVRQLSEAQLSEMLSGDPFFMCLRFAEETAE